MEVVEIKWVPTNLGLTNAINACIRQSNLGFEKLVYEGDGYVLMADTYVHLGEVEVDMIEEYYKGMSPIDTLVDERGVPLKLRD